MRGLCVKGTMKVLGVLVLLVPLVGCSTRIGDFTVGSTKNIGLLSQKGETVSGEDCTTKLFGWIPIAGPTAPNFKTAMDQALERAKGDVVADAVMWSSYYHFLLVSQECFKVEGKVARGEFG